MCAVPVVRWGVGSVLSLRDAVCQFIILTRGRSLSGSRTRMLLGLSARW